MLLLTKPSLDLFPRKCTYAKVIDLRNMVLWSIGFIANRYRITPHQINLCPLLLDPPRVPRCGSPGATSRGFHSVALPWYCITQVSRCIEYSPESFEGQWRTQKIFMGDFYQWHMVVICIWCSLFVTSQFDVIFMFPNQRFGEVCWHNMHILLHALPLIFVSWHWI